MLNQKQRVRCHYVNGNMHAFKCVAGSDPAAQRQHSRRNVSHNDPFQLQVAPIHDVIGKSPFR